MSLVNVKRSEYLYHDLEFSVWNDVVESFYGVTDSITELRQELDVDKGEEEKILDRLAEKSDREIVVWHNYDRGHTHLMEVNK